MKKRLTIVAIISAAIALAGAIFFVASGEAANLAERYAFSIVFVFLSMFALLLVIVFIVILIVSFGFGRRSTSTPYTTADVMAARAQGPCPSCGSTDIYPSATMKGMKFCKSCEHLW